MTNADIQIHHQHAREQHADRQKIEGLRHAARVLECSLPNSRVQAATVKAIAVRLREDAAELERNLR